MEATETKPFRELMPYGFLPELVKRTGAKRPNISNVVNDESTTNKKIWPKVVELAMEKNPEETLRRLEYLKNRE